MTRSFCTVVVVVIVTSGMPSSGAQSLPVLSRSQAALDKAKELNDQVNKLYQENKFQEAVPLAEQSLALREKALGSTHPDVAESLNDLAEVYVAQGVYGKAEPLLVRALDIREKALGAMHQDVAASLENLGGLYQRQGKYDKAESLLIRALDIREKTLGGMNPDVARSLIGLGLLYWVQSAYDKAEPLLIRALDIREKTLGGMNPDMATSLNSLGLLYKYQGKFDKAEPLYRRALDIREKAQGAMHPDVAVALNNLASLYQVQGGYGNAEPLLVRALDIREKTLGPMHPEVAGGLNNLALLYCAQGAYRKAEPLLVRALDIRERALGAMHPEVAASLDHLAMVYKAQGVYAKAESLCARALHIREKVLGLMHLDVAISLNNLAAVYDDEGEYAKARLLYGRALHISEKVLGAMHPTVATILNNLAAIYKKQNAYRKAEPLLVRALRIDEMALGAMHPDVAKYLNNLASLYQAQGAYAKAEPLVARAADIQEDQLRRELARLSESRKRALMLLLQRDTEGVVSMQADAMPTDSQALELAFTTVLRRKGRVLDSLAENQSSLFAHLNPALRGTFQQLADSNAELSIRLRASYDPRNAVRRTAAIADLRAHIDDLQTTLNTASTEFRVRSELVTVAKIQAALPHGTALVEFVRYHRFDPRKVPAQQEARYVAYLLLRQGPPQWIALGEAAPIDTGIDAVLTAMQRGGSADMAKLTLQHLDALVFAPIRGQLTGISHLILSPDSKLNLVPFEALIDPQGHYVLENWLISYVGSGRDLLRFAARSAPRSTAMIVAAPDYGPLRSPAPSGLGSFRPLEGALAEAQELPAYLPRVRTWTGKQATKAILAAAVGPSVLHIATHGFFARSTTSTSTSFISSAGTSHRATTPLGGGRGMHVEDTGFSSFVPPPPTLEDPSEALDQAGLALAEANLRSDGIVTAREIAGFDWWGTQLVVLSACETGVGAVPSGDGVYGLRRALVLAGAASQVVSLWSVSDTSTRALMRDYYSELVRGTGRAEALRQAKLRLMRQPRYAHPYYWAAFIPAGDWRPLDKTVFSPRG